MSAKLISAPQWIPEREQRDEHISKEADVPRVDLGIKYQITPGIRLGVTRGPVLPNLFSDSTV